MTFNPDERNLGGRKEIYERLNNHYQAMQHVGPMVHNLKPPRAHVDQGGYYFGDNDDYMAVYKSNTQSTFGYGKKNKKNIYEQLQSSPEFSEVREAMRRVRNVTKGDTDHAKPNTYNLSKKLTQNRRRNMFHFEEHIKNLASL